jgi:hypothetical protein
MSGFKVSARGDFARLEQKLRGAEKQIPFAAALALTATAKKVKEAERDAMARVFNRPRPYTLNSLKVKSASKRDLRAEVWFREFPKSASDYLGPQVFAGDRRLKRSEESIARKNTAAQGKFFVPGQRAKLDRYGNVNRGVLVRIISDLQVSNDKTQNRNADKKPGQYFLGTPGKAPLGVYRRKEDGGVEPVFIAVDNPRYTKRLRFFEIGGMVAKRELITEFDKAAKRALATAR